MKYNERDTKPVTVAELGAYLMSLPPEAQALEVWYNWDESGEAWGMFEPKDVGVEAFVVVNPRRPVTRSGAIRYEYEGPASDFNETIKRSKKRKPPKGAKKVFML